MGPPRSGLKREGGALDTGSDTALSLTGPDPLIVPSAAKPPPHTRTHLVAHTSARGTRASPRVFFFFRRVLRERFLFFSFAEENRCSNAPGKETFVRNARWFHRDSRSSFIEAVDAELIFAPGQCQHRETMTMRRRFCRSAPALLGRAADSRVRGHPGAIELFSMTARHPRCCLRRGTREEGSSAAVEGYHVADRVPLRDAPAGEPD